MGFMASGKSRIGRLLSDRLSWTFYDTDDLIIEKAGNMPIPEIFSQFGEAKFREIEKEVVREVANLEQTVISLGGGAVVDPENWQTITASGTTICLSYPPEIIERRVSRKNNRPLLQLPTREERLERIGELLKKRESAYQKADLILHLNVEIDAERVADSIAAYLGVDK